MNGINGYQVYQKNYTQNMTYAGTYEKQSLSKQTDKKQDTEQLADVYKKGNIAEVKKEPVALSDNAKALLEKLKQKYTNMDFTVASYSSSREAQKYLAGGRKEYSVLIAPQLLEQMAADKETEAKYTGMLETAVNQLSGMKEELGEDSEAVRLGVSFGADGSTTFFAELEKVSERQREQIEKTREAKKKEKKEAAKKAEEDAERKQAEEVQKEDSGKNPYGKNKRIRLYADSAETLLEKIRGVEWDKVKTEEAVMTGSVIDFGI